MACKHLSSKLTEQSLFYENAFANGRVSMDALPSTILGLPRLFKAPFIRTPYFNNHIESLPQLLKKYGYSSSLYHGAYNGSLYMDTFAEMTQFDQFHGFNEYARMYPDKSQTDLSKWGVFDDQFMQYMAQDLSKKTQPFSPLCSPCHRTILMKFQSAWFKTILKKTTSV